MSTTSARPAPQDQGPGPVAGSDPDPIVRPGPTGRSHALDRRSKVVAAPAIVAFVAYVVWANVGWASQSVWLLVTFYSVLATMTAGLLLSGFRWRRFDHLPVAPGRVITLIPVYNEPVEHVRDTVAALLAQSRRPDEIHVIDDGSEPPLETFEAPGVTWHRQPNGGKRAAQALVLRALDPAEWDFILTVDSDSVPDVDALEHLLRSMSEDSVMAATGMILVRNRTDNLLTRLVDINVVTSCLMPRMLRSWFGVVTPTSGALALYRAPVVLDHLEDYVSSGTAGDDRRLSFYALQRGEVVGVTESVVETHLPTTIGGTFRQRLRWSKSAWLGLPYACTRLRPLALFFYCYPLLFALLWPVVVTLLALGWFWYDAPGLLLGLLYWEVVAAAMTWGYAVYRPDLTFRERVGAVLLAPVYPLLGLFVLRPAAYWALTKLRSDSWHTR